MTLMGIKNERNCESDQYLDLPLLYLYVLVGYLNHIFGIFVAPNDLDGQ